MNRSQFLQLSCALSFLSVTSCSKPPAAKEAEPCDRQVVTAAVISTKFINLTGR